MTTHVQKVVGSDPGAVYWMDIWTFFTFICCKNRNVCLKRAKINEKEAGFGPLNLHWSRETVLTWRNSFECELKKDEKSLSRFVSSFFDNF